ncbi:MAG TPA: glycosyltransferase [Candidatus Polarisedimenticolia bacterium]|nr:glycosyltransferase [Candidatus Polarisedimenticolia bacterium]
MTLRAALLTPFAPPSVRGNAITVDRIAQGLTERGLDVRVWDLSVTPEAAVEAGVGAYRPALIHAFHAFRVGPLALRLARRLEAPLLVTVTGTDANDDLLDPERAPAVRRVLEGAGAVAVFHESIRERIAGALPGVIARVAVVPQSVRLPTGEPFDLAARWPLPADRVLFLFPAGVRRVKRPRLPLAPFDRLVAVRPQARLLYAGPVLEPVEGEALLAEIARRPWARHLGAVPHPQMRWLLEAADAVINASAAEGGMANSVLEAMAVGRAVLASDIEGHRSLVEDGITGLLFRTEDELEAGARRLVDQPGLRRALGQAGRAKLLRLYPPERELDDYVALYHRLVPARQT